MRHKRLNDKYSAWSKKNEVEATLMRSILFITHGSPNNRSKTEFAKFLVSGHAMLGKAWDLWLSTSEWQKRYEEWQRIAQCDMKMAKLNI